MKLPPSLWGALAGAAGVLAFAPAVGTALEDLSAARTERQAAQIAATAPPASPPRGAIRASSSGAANDQIIARVRNLAARGAVLVEVAAPMSDSADLARVRLRVSGSEDAVVALADTLERGPLLMRFARWRIEAAGTAVRLQGEVVAPWQ